MPRAIASLLVLGDPLSLNSDQHQFSPNNINTLLTEKIMKINKMITEGDLLSNSLNQFLKEMYGDQSAEFVYGYWGLKG